jgi:predicted ATPase
LTAQPQRIVITGAPGGGKSSLIDAAAAAGIAVQPEVARAILQVTGGMALRRDDPIGFAQAMLTAEHAAYEAAQPGGVTLYDRGFPDIAGFLTVEGFPIPCEIDAACQDLRYDGPIFRAPPWAAIYAQDAERIQSWDQAVASDAAVCAAWRSYGYDVIDLPFAPVAERLRFILQHIS